MEENFYQDELEQFLREQANDHRMFPSDGVWRNIYKQIHGDRNWPALTIAAFTLLIATVAICVHFSPKPNIFAIPETAVVATKAANPSKSNLAARATLQIDKDNAVLVDNSAWNNAHTSKNSAIVSNPTILPANELVASAQADISSAAVVASNKNVHTPSTVDNNQDNGIVTLQSPAAGKGLLITTEPLSQQKITEGKTSTANQPKQKLLVAKDDDDKNIGDKYLKENKADLVLHSTKKVAPRTSRFSYTVYISPSISYRKLTEDRSFMNRELKGPVALNYVAGVHQIVRHKPGNGLETGFGMLYRVSGNLKIKTGLQFNVRQYSIEAYRFGTEVASIALIHDKRIDTVTSLAIYRSTNGNAATEINNRYYQVSMPVGVDWQVAGGKALQLNLGATIQPTYLINRNAFILSSNYQNYTESASIVKRWNANAGLEAYLSFKVGDYKWQLGPQIRYQLMPTLIKEYPIKEHLMDYGIKFGVTRPFR